MRTPSMLAALALVASATAAVTTSTSASAAPATPEDFIPRWCSVDPTTPCLESATLDTGTGPVAITKDDDDWHIESTGRLTGAGGGYEYFMWQVVPQRPPMLGPQLATNDTWSLTFDTGTLDPEYTEAYAGKPVVQRTADGDGTHHVTYTGRPVLTTEGCSDTWPPKCPSTATDWRIQLSGEVHQKNQGKAWNGFDRSQSIDDVNGIFLEKAPDGSRYLLSEMANSHQYDNDRSGPGTTVTPFTGEVRFRVPYAMLRDYFEVPNPETMVASSLSGSVRKPDGTPSPATWNVVNDTVGQALLVDVSDITFSRKVLRVKRGVITPTPPTRLSEYRTSPRRGAIGYDESDARGANVTGYKGRCVATKGDHVTTSTADGSETRMYFAGLRRGVGYDCKIRAQSKAGPGKWSKVATMPAQVTLPA